MKFRWRRILVVTGLVVAGGLFLLWRMDESESRAERASTHTLKKSEIDLLREGDIIMRKGYGMVSRMIVSNLNEARGLSHCGIVVRTENGWGVIHTVSASLSDVDGMQLNDLNEFVRQSKPGTIVVSRLRHCEDRSRIAEEAYRYLNSAITFDHSFDLADSSRFYCSELIWHVMKNAAHVDIYDGNYQDLAFYSFEKLMSPDKFDLVIDHFKP